MKYFRFELFFTSLLLFGSQILFVRAFNLFFTEIDVQALIPWSFAGILLSCLLLSASEFFWARWIMDRLDFRFVCAVLFLYAVSCFFVIDQKVALLMVVSLNLGLGMCLAHAAMRMEAYNFYVIDFVGGIVGSVLAFLLPDFWSLEATYLLFFFFATLPLVLQAKPQSRFRKYAMGLTATSFLFFAFLAVKPLHDLSRFGALYQKPDDAAISPGRHGQLNLQNGKLTRLDSAWSSVGKIEVFKVTEDPSDYEFYVNNINYFSFFNQEPRIPGTFGENKKALVVGSGGGLELRFLRDQGFKDLTAVEINEVVYDWTKGKLAKEAGDIFAQTNYIRGEGRNFVESTEGQYDVIVINYIGNAGGLIGSSDDLSENYLFTKEAFKSYYKKLNSGGLLFIGLAYSESPALYPVLLRTVESEATVLRENNENPQEQMWVFGQKRKKPSKEFRRYQGFVVMRKGAASATEETFIGDLRKALFYDSSYAISHPSGMGQSFAASDENLTEQEKWAKAALKESQTENAKAAFNVNISPVSDSRPYFFQFAGSPSFPLKPAGLIFWFSVVALLGMTAFLLKRKNALLANSENRKILLLASTLGFAYGLLEIALMNSFTILFSSMVWNFSLMVFGLLLGAVLAGLIGPSLTSSTRKTLIGLSAVLLLCVFFYDFRSVVFTWDDHFRSYGIIIFTLIISFGISLAYPLLLKIGKLRDPQMPALILGYNSGFFIIGSIVCRYLSLTTSLQHSFLVAGILYILVMIALPKATTK